MSQYAVAILPEGRNEPPGQLVSVARPRLAGSPQPETYIGNTVHFIPKKLKPTFHEGDKVCWAFF